MHRHRRPAITLATSLFLAGCGAQLPPPPVGLKDEQPRLQQALARPDVPASAVVRPGAIKIVVSGGEGLTRLDLDLAMAQALRRRGFTVVTEGQAWTIAATVGASHIEWTVKDSAGLDHASIRQDIAKPGEVRGQDAVSAASAAANSVARIIPSPKGEKL